MRTLMRVFEVLLLIHALLIAGGLVWLWQSDRLNRSRVENIAQTFSMTAKEQQLKIEQAQEEREAKHDQLEADQRIAVVSKGPRTLRDRLSGMQTADELRQLQTRMISEQTQRLRSEMTRLQEQLQARQDELDLERDRQQAIAKAQANKIADQDFAKAVDLLGRLEAPRSARVFQAMLNDGRRDEVVAFVASMPPRKAAEVLGALETTTDVSVVSDLIDGIAENRAKVWTGDDQENDTP